MEALPTSRATQAVQGLTLLDDGGGREQFIRPNALALYRPDEASTCSPVRASTLFDPGWAYGEGQSHDSHVPAAERDGQCRRSSEATVICRHAWTSL